MRATPNTNAVTSSTDCQKCEFSRSSGITDTVAIYINPPAVKGNIQETVEASTRKDKSTKILISITFNFKGLVDLYCFAIE